MVSDFFVGYVPAPKLGVRAFFSSTHHNFVVELILFCQFVVLYETEISPYMKTNNILYVILAVVFAFSLLNYIQIQSLKNAEPVAKEVQKEEKIIEKEIKKEVELAVLMGYQQRYLEKLYFAGINANWPLADFYHHELEETLEDIIEGDIEEDGYNVSGLSKAMLLPAVEALENSIKNKDEKDFVTKYNAVVNSCNACHTATKHGFIKIIVPKESSFKNQDFSK